MERNLVIWRCAGHSHISSCIAQAKGNRSAVSAKQVTLQSQPRVQRQQQHQQPSSLPSNIQPALANTHFKITFHLYFYANTFTPWRHDVNKATCWECKHKWEREDPGCYGNGTRQTGSSTHHSSITGSDKLQFSSLIDVNCPNSITSFSSYLFIYIIL